MLAVYFLPRFLIVFVARRLQIVAGALLVVGLLRVVLPEGWQFTRNRYTRTIYDACYRLGITATWMIEYVASLDATDAADPHLRTGLSQQYSVESVDASTVAPLEAPVDELQPGEEIIAVTERGTPRGYLFLSVDTSQEIHPLEERRSFEGAYIRRVFVDQDHRNEGLASAMVAFGLQRAVERGASTVSALVALDNTPSQRLFERHEFQARRHHRYVRIGPFTHRSVRDT